MKRINQVDTPEVNKLMMKLREGKYLVKKCSKVQPWNYYLKSKYSRLLQELDDNLIRFFQLDVQTAIWCDVEQLLDKMNDMNQKIDQLTAERGCCSSYNTGVGAEAAALTNQMMMNSGEANEKVKKSSEKGIITSDGDRHRESIAPTASINAHAALEMPLFRDDESVAFFSKSMGGVGKTSLSQNGQKDILIKYLSDRIRDPKSSSVTLLYKDLQLAVTRFHSSGPVDFDDDIGFHQVKELNHRYMELVEKFSHENVAPVRAYYYSCRSRAVDESRQLALGIILVYDYSYYFKGSVFEMLHGTPSLYIYKCMYGQICFGVVVKNPGVWGCWF
ncbi:uncharacterized protein LOC113352082 [Papaver somniferum]|uniref:uncharacterized protein LOC113352082 n=1 Tax=Papaver somniferum TaxID=3469 RepID=UPI000E6FC804|nr:uncharacterized protein LOC113352082 [Papaver somniferum]